MNILEKQAVHLADAKVLAGDLGEKPLAAYFKAYCKLSKKDADKLSEELLGLNNIKVKGEHVIKLIDFLPQSVEEVHKVFGQALLTEEEAGQVVGIIKPYL